MDVRNLFENDDRAVSPVIGVILMVAITVILAAVIGTFVLGLGGQVNQNANAAVSVETTTDNATVTLVSKGNTQQVNVTNTTGSNVAKTLTNVGNSTTVDFDGNDIQVIGVLPDGTETVIRTVEQ